MSLNQDFLARLCEQIDPLIRRADWASALVGSWRALTEENPDYADLEKLPLAADVHHLVAPLVEALGAFAAATAGHAVEGVEPSWQTVLSQLHAQPLLLLAALDELLKFWYEPRRDGDAAKRATWFLHHIDNVTVRQDWMEKLGFRSSPDRDYCVVEKVDSGLSATERTNKHFQSFLKFHRIIDLSPTPQVRVKVHPCPTGQETLSHWQVRGNQGLRVYLAEFSNIEFHSQTIERPDSALNWNALGLKNEETLLKELVAHLSVAKANEANVVLFPELTVTPAMRSRAKQWMATDNRRGHCIDILVAGSFHDSETGMESARVFCNQALVFDRLGTPILELSHRKFDPVDFRKSAVPYSPWNKTQLVECIEVGRTINMVLSPIGTQTVVICLDFAEGSPKKIPWEKLFINWLWVPALSPRINPFIKHASALTLNSPSFVAVANQAEVPELGMLRKNSEHAQYQGSEDLELTAIPINGEVASGRATLVQVRPHPGARVSL